MELKAYFANIHKVIIGHLEQAQFEIVAAVGWFTERDIFEVLRKKARAKVKISIALIGDDINQGQGSLNFHLLSNLGCPVIFLPPGSPDEPMMDHNFCVIDGQTVITGSFNWSQKATSNDENITVVTEAPDFASKYLETFNNIRVRAARGAPVIADKEAARRRLEMIRNLILLGEQEDLATHVRKLRPVADALHVSRIISALDNGEFKTALEEIDTYLRKATALFASELADVVRLRFVLETLELRLESLTEEKAELERRLITFNRRYDEVLGDLIQRILKARAEQERKRAAKHTNDNDRGEAEAKAREAEDAYDDYSRQHEELQQAEPLPTLDEEAERELKLLYRKAASLCHPDKVTETMKEAAHRVFVELQEAYKSNDLRRIREIYDMLKAGGIPERRSTTLSEAESLQAAIAELEYIIARLLADLRGLCESDGVRLMEAAGSSEAGWQAYLERQRQAMEMELAKLVMSSLDAAIKE